MIGSSTSLTPKRSVPRPSPVQSSQPAPDRYVPPAAPRPSTGRPSAGVSYGGQSTVRPPQYIDINTTEDAVNNVLAQGVQQGDHRYQMKQLDRAGFSRGKGQQYAAAQEGQQVMGQAAGQAAEIRSQDQMANAKMRADYEKMREQEAQASAMAAHSRGQSNWALQFAKRQAASNIAMQQQQAAASLLMASLSRP